MNPKSLLRFAIQLAIAIALSLSIVSCASPATAAGMTYQDSMGEVPEHLLKSISVGEVQGGKSTNAWFSPHINHPELKEALGDSLKSAGYLAVADDSSYTIDAEIVDEAIPAGGLDIAAWLTVRYMIYPNGQVDKPIYDHTLKTGYEVPFRMAFSGTERMREALEGAARDNFQQLLLGMQEL